MSKVKKDKIKIINIEKQCPNCKSYNTINHYNWHECENCKCKWEFNHGK